MKYTIKINLIIVITATFFLAGVACYNPFLRIKPKKKASLIEMVWIKPGTFMMGSPLDEPNRESNETQHEVTLTKGFYIAKYQVTQKLYCDLMETTIEAILAMGPYGPGFGYFGRGDNYPVYSVSFYEAIVFCNKLSKMENLNPVYYIGSPGINPENPEEWAAIPTTDNAVWNTMKMREGANGYRLPTEAEWEYACRAGTTTAYNVPLPNGSNTITDNTGWYNANSESKTHEVGLKPPNAWGLYDMHGNVYEWCWDNWDRLTAYGSGHVTDPIGTTGNGHITRGGAWGSLWYMQRSAYRGFNGSFSHGADGIRLVRGK